MLEDGSEKIRLVERELVHMDEGENVSPVLLGFAPGGLTDGMKLEGDHRDHSGGGDGGCIAFRLLQNRENFIVHEHQIDRWERQLGGGFILVKGRRLGENPVAKSKKLLSPSL